MVPAVIPLLLLMPPAMLTALAVVREKELGSIINLYITPTTRTEFMLGKQLPYVALAMLNFGLMALAVVTGVSACPSRAVCHADGALLLFSLCSTGVGVAGVHRHAQPDCGHVFAMVGTDPGGAVSGAHQPVSSLVGVARWIGEVYPASHMFTISRGVFSKALSLQDLQPSSGRAGDLGPGHHRHRHCAAAQTGELIARKPFVCTFTRPQPLGTLGHLRHHLPPGHQRAVEPVARPDDAGLIVYTTTLAVYSAGKASQRR